MADTIPNVTVAAGVPTDIYAATNIAVGTQITVKMIGNGNGKLFAGAALTQEPDNSTGYRPIRPNEEWINDVGDSGAWIWSRQGCTINVEVA